MIHTSDAGWSSLAARRAHNPKVVGSNPAPATKLIKAWRMRRAFFICGAGKSLRKQQTRQRPPAQHARTGTHRRTDGLGGSPAKDSVGLRISHWIPVFTATRPGYTYPGHAPKRPRQSGLGGMPATTRAANTQANSGKAGTNRRPACGARRQTGVIFLRQSISRT